MTNLSPAAQAVLDAYGKYPLHGNHIAETLIHGALPAALRAAADQVVPIPRLPYDSCCDVHAVAIRAELLAIAAELGTFSK
jgi:hypothetical protein